MKNDFVDLPSVYLNKNEERKILSGLPWLYSNQVEMRGDTKTLPPGALVIFREKNGGSVALGYFNRHQLIAGRILTLNTAETLNAAFFAQRIKSALTCREWFFDEPYYRLVHAESDFLPGLIIDRFNDVVVVQPNTHGAETILPLVVEALQTTLTPKSIVIFRHQRSRKLENLDVREPEIIGEAITHLDVLENGVAFKIELQGAQKTGWFYDHRDNRKLMAALSKGKTVIDYFCYAGSFALQCAKAGATKAIGIDQSETAIAAAKASAKLNQVEKTTEFTVANVFEDIEKRIALQQRFDMVLLDPPAFVKSKKDLAAGLKGYQKLIARALLLVQPGGMLMIASCSYHVSETDLQTALQKALVASSRMGRIVKRLSFSACHPKHPALQEGEYLKGLLVEVI